MKIENLIRKRIKAIAILSGTYPDAISITEEEFKQLNGTTKIDGVELHVKEDLIKRRKI